MSRRKKSYKKNIYYDPRYNNAIIGLMINIIMKDGKKSLSQKIVYQAFAKVSVEIGKGNPVDLLLIALENVKPRLEVKSRRLGGSTYQVPVEIPYSRQNTLAIKWMKSFAQNRKGMSMAEALSKEIVDAYNNTGSVLKKKENMHKMAQANKAFAHLKW